MSDLITDRNRSILEPVHTVHDALVSALISKNKSSNKEKKISFRIDHDIRDQAQKICAKHGTTISSYFRACAESLVKDYNPDFQSKD